ncbi:MAG: MoaD/ThiS family protein [Chloroflexi bacterium]|nr:MoaD/ThiS family protein [Chloroflexota bacterium]
MIKCTVEMWGLPREVSGMPAVEVQLEADAGLSDVIAALKRQIPALEGSVICHGENRLEDTCVFNIDGQFLLEDEKLRLKDGDCLRLLTLATGG